MVFVPLTFNAAASNLVFTPAGPGSVTSTVGNNASIAAVYTQQLTAVRLDYQAPQTPSIVALVLGLYTTETGFIDLNNFGPPIQNSSGVFPGPYTAIFNGIAVTITETNGGVWGEQAFGSINADGSLRLFTGFPLVQLAFSQPVSNFTLQGWGAWSGGSDMVVVSGETAPAQQVVAGSLPCDCCPSGLSPRCGLTPIIFDGAHNETMNGGGISSYNLPARWSDGDTSGGAFTGYNSPPVQFTAANSPVMELNFAVPQDRIRGLREWNQGGGDLGDLDGFASWDFEFFAGATSLATGNMVMGNGGAPFTHLLPGGQELGGVTRVRLSNMRKLNPGAGVSPLVREVQALQFQPTFSCRRRDGALHWFVGNGTEIPASDVVPCP